MTDEPLYPEHDKLMALEGKKEVVQDFIDWLFDKSKYHLCEDVSEYSYDQELMTTFDSREAIMADYFDIDLKKLSKEKDAMWTAFRKRTSGL